MATSRDGVRSLASITCGLGATSRAGRPENSPEPFGDGWQEPCADACGDSGFEDHAWDKDDHAIVDRGSPCHGIRARVVVSDEPQPWDTDGEDDGVNDEAGGEDGDPASDGVVFSADDPVREGLAGDEPKKIAAGLSDDGEPSGVAFCEDPDADRAGDDVEQHGDRAEL